MTSHLAFYLKSSGILPDTLPGLLSGIVSDSDFLTSGIYSDILSGILSDIRYLFWPSFWGEIRGSQRQAGTRRSGIWGATPR